MKRKEKLKESVCMKCKQAPAVVVIRVQDPMCAACFLTYVTHKFRSTLGKSKLVQPNDNVLIAMSGGHASSALLHLVRGALSLGAHKRLRFSPGVVCVDESVLLATDNAQDYSHIAGWCEEFGYPFHLVPIFKDFATDLGNESNIVNGSNGVNGLNGFNDTNGVNGSNDIHTNGFHDMNGVNGEVRDINDERDRQKFQECFNTITSLTAKQDFLTTRRAYLISRVAQSHNYKKVMFGDTSTSLCMKLIANISMGRGNTVALDLGVADRRFPGLTIIRPLREVASKEVALFNRLSGIRVDTPCNITTMKSSGSSLQQKTEEFINGLQADFPHTVNTVFRTGDKVCSTEQNTEETMKCPMCHSPLKTGHATTPPTTTTTATTNGCKEKDEGCCGSGGGECKSSSGGLTIDDIRGQICYACNLTFQDMGSRVDVLPPYIVRHTSEQMKRDKMKDSIKDFLLD